MGGALSCNNKKTLPISPLNGLQKGIWEIVEGSDKILLTSLLKKIPENLDIPDFFEPPVFYIDNDTSLTTFDNNFLNLELSRNEEKGWYLIYQKLEYAYLSNWNIEPSANGDTLKFSFKDINGKTLVLPYTNSCSKSETDIDALDLASFLHQSSWAVTTESGKKSNIAFKQNQPDSNNNNALYLSTIQNSIAEQSDSNFIYDYARIYQLEAILLFHFHDLQHTYDYLYGIKFINNSFDSISLLPFNKDFDHHEPLILKKDSLSFKELD